MLHIIPEKRVVVDDIAPEVAELCAAHNITIMVWAVIEANRLHLRVVANEIYSLPEAQEYIKRSNDVEQRYSGSVNWGWSTLDDDEADEFVGAYIKAQRALYPKCKIIR